MFFAAAVATIGLSVLVLGFAELARAIAVAGAEIVMVVATVATILGVRQADGVGLALAVGVVSTVASVWAKRGDARTPVLNRAIDKVMTRGGTSFRGADLTGVNFDGARVRNADFRGAHLDHARFDGAREIAFCRFDPGKGPSFHRERRLAGLRRH
jgi:hypothetical protein